MNLDTATRDAAITFGEAETPQGHEYVRTANALVFSEVHSVGIGSPAKAKPTRFMS